MKLYLCETRQEADASAAALGIRTLGEHAFYGDDCHVAWFFGEPSTPVTFHTAEPISAQLLGVKNLLGRADEVVIVDTGSSCRRDAITVLDLLGYVGTVSFFTSPVSAGLAKS